MTLKTQLHQLIDALPESELLTVERFVASLYKKKDPVLWRLLTAPEDDEPETPEEAEAVRKAKARMAAGDAGVPHEEILILHVLPRGSAYQD